MSRFTKQTSLDGIRKPTAAEAKRGADVVFERSDAEGREYTILGCSCYESWEQWGQPAEVLSDNCDAIENWRHGGMQLLDGAE
jgi:hypothetical protein